MTISVRKSGLTFAACALACALLLSVSAWAKGGGGGGHGGGGHGARGGGHGGGHGMHRGGGRHFGAGRAMRSHAVRHGGRSFARPSFRAQRQHALRGGPRVNAVRAANVHQGAPGLVARDANRARSAFAVQRALNARPVARALGNPMAMRDPRARAFVTAGLATAAWSGGGWPWWQHANGGFGWVGPVFWPFAYRDIYDYAFWGAPYAGTFWGYGYGDLYAGIFGPYGYDDLMGYAPLLPRYAGREQVPGYANLPRGTRTDLSSMCGDDGRVIAGLPLEAFQEVIGPNAAQRAALDELASASAKAAETLQASCPAEAALTAPRRLEVMQLRLEAMLGAVQTLQPPLAKFYGTLSDEQKAEINALAIQQRAQRRRSARAAAAAAPPEQVCEQQQAGFNDWPSAAIEQGVKPNEQQQKALARLRNAANDAAEQLRASCFVQADAQTPPARLAAVGQRLERMLQAVKSVRTALGEFYGTLSDEQKAAFDAIGPQQLGFAERPQQARRDYR
jgi:hypothetical protein